MAHVEAAVGSVPADPPGPIDWRAGFLGGSWSSGLVPPSLEYGDRRRCSPGCRPRPRCASIAAVDCSDRRPWREPGAFDLRIVVLSPPSVLRIVVAVDLRVHPRVRRCSASASGAAAATGAFYGLVCSISSTSAFFSALVPMVSAEHRDSMIGPSFAHVVQRRAVRRASARALRKRRSSSRDD